VAPVVLLLAVTVNAAVQNQALVSTLLETRLIGDALLLMFTLFSYVAVWGIFTFFYTFMPNTPVQIIPASIGGVLGGALWQLAQWAYIDFQVGVSRYHAIYGALAQLPVLMVWIYLSWAIVLLGAEVSCACQRVTLYAANRFAASPSHYAREWLAQALYFSLTRAYLAGAGSWSASAFARQYRLPLRVLHEVLRPLLVARLLVEDAAAPDHYVPGRDPATLTPWQILQTIRHDDHVGLETVMTCVEPHATGLMTRVEEAVQQVAATRSMTQWLADGEPDGQSEPPTTAAT
jgi:membrane protein